MKAHPAPSLEIGIVWWLRAGLRSAVMLAFLSVAPCDSHDWYTGKYNTLGNSCCGGQDCHPLPAPNVRTEPKGFHIRLGKLDMIMPYEMALPSEDDGYHICINSYSGAVTCFFAPPLNF
jgi:hypothetical protein